MLRKNNQIRQFQTALLLSKGRFSQNRWETSHPRTSARTRWATSPPRWTCRTRSTMSTHRSQISTRWTKFSKALFVKESFFVSRWTTGTHLIQKLRSSTLLLQVFTISLSGYIIWIYLPTRSINEDKNHNHYSLLSCDNQRFSAWLHLPLEIWSQVLSSLTFSDKVGLIP